MSKLIDLRFAQEEQKHFLEHLKSIEGINYQEQEFEVAEWQIIALASELYEVANVLGVHKWWSKEEVNKNRLIEELSDCLSHLANIANILDMELVTDLDCIQVTSLEKQFLSLNNHLLNIRGRRKCFQKHKTMMIYIEFIELVYSLGFNVEELSEAYLNKMDCNYKRFI